MLKKIILSVIFLSFSFGITGAELAKQLNLAPNSKAALQWESVFKSKRKMKRLGINKLSEEEKKILKKYLITHAADSDEPVAAGM